MNESKPDSNFPNYPNKACLAVIYVLSADKLQGWAG